MNMAKRNAFGRKKSSLSDQLSLFMSQRNLSNQIHSLKGLNESCADYSLIHTQYNNHRSNNKHYQSIGAGAMGSGDSSSGNTMRFGSIKNISPYNLSTQQNLSGFIDANHDSINLNIRKNHRKQLGLGTFDRYNDLNGENYQGLDGESNEKFWNNYESVTSKRVNNNMIKSS